MLIEKLGKMVLDDFGEYQSLLPVLVQGPDFYPSFFLPEKFFFEKQRQITEESAVRHLFFSLMGKSLASLTCQFFQSQENSLYH